MWVAAGILILCSGVKNGKPGKPLKKIPIITRGWKISNMDLSLILIGFEKGLYKKLLISHFCSEIAKSRGVLPSSSLVFLSRTYLQRNLKFPVVPSWKQDAVESSHNYLKF